MSILQTLSIAQRLAIGFGGVLVLLAVMAAVATLQMSRLAHNTAYFATNLVPSYEVGHKVARLLGDLRRFENRHVLAQAQDDIDTAEARIAAARTDILKALDRYAADRVSDDNDKRHMAEARATIEAYFGTWDTLRTTSRQKLVDPLKNTEAIAFLQGASSAAYEAAHQAVGAWWDYKVKLASEQTKTANTTYERARLIVLSLAAMSVALGTLAAALIARSVTRPIGEAVKVARAVAAGNLSLRVQATGKDETGQLLAALAEMTDTLSRVVGSVRTGSDSVATASAQIAQGNADLSQRTEQQASALEQTASTMEQLGSTVRNNADSARQANQLAQDAADVAAQGGEVVGQVVSTMHGISASGRKIGDIVSVIDGIAFQTNILALNAAVEAARAGEQGRGFAVVAAEVRTLARRSAEAAREIKDLIGRNVEQVERGSALVDQAGKTMDEIVGSIKRVSDLMAEISTATVEQSNGIHQVGDAVGQMDRTTQQNAALVEQSAAAAESLKSQAGQLVQAVAFFKLTPEAARAA